MDLEPSTQPISKLEFEFERRKLTKEDVRELIYREVYFLVGALLKKSIMVLFMDNDLCYQKQTDIGVSSSDAPGIPSRCRSDKLFVS